MNDNIKTLADKFVEDATAAGLAARLRGWDLSDNPYAAEELKKAWEEGYKSVKDQYDKNMREHTWKWFKHGKQFDARCNAVAANGQPAKPSIIVFVEDAADARSTVVKELSRYGYTNITIDKLVKV